MDKKTKHFRWEDFKGTQHIEVPEHPKKSDHYDKDMAKFHLYTFIAIIVTAFGSAYVVLSALSYRTFHMGLLQSLVGW